MKCPLCTIPLEQAILSNVGVDYCPRCYGLWFEEDELQWAKDEHDADLRWLDIDLWKHPDQFRVEAGKQRLCPVDRLPLYEVRYGDSNVRIDVCNICHGIWLDRGEFKDIIVYLHDRGEYEVLHNYAGNLFEELWEVFSGPEVLREEVLDFLAILKLLKYKFATQHPAFSRFMLSLPR